VCNSGSLSGRVRNGQGANKAAKTAFHGEIEMKKTRKTLHQQRINSQRHSLVTRISNFSQTSFNFFNPIYAG
jgi:hypothetical protein